MPGVKRIAMDGRQLDEYLTVLEVSRILRMHPQTVGKWLRQGKINGVLLSNQVGWRIPKEEVARLLKIKVEELSKLLDGA